LYPAVYCNITVPQSPRYTWQHQSINQPFYLLSKTKQSDNKIFSDKINIPIKALMPVLQPHYQNSLSFTLFNHTENGRELIWQSAG